MNGQLTELYERFGYIVFKRCRAILGSEHEAQDILQDVFLEAIQKNASFEKAESKVGWLYRIGERRCFDRLRKLSREVNLDSQAVQRVAQSGVPQHSHEAKEVIMAFLGRFDTKLQQVAILYYFDGLTQERIASELGWSRKTVGRKITLLRKRALEQANVYLEHSTGGIK